MPYRDKVAIVTGASSGIGAAVARELAAGAQSPASAQRTRTGRRRRRG